MKFRGKSIIGIKKKIIIVNNNVCEEICFWNSGMDPKWEKKNKKENDEEDPKKK